MNAITPGVTMRSLLAWLLVDRLAEPDSRAASILIDELDARFLERNSYRPVVWRRQRGLVLTELRTTNCGNAYSRLASKIFRAPSNKSTGGSDLSTR
jgi:hypothetical protein